MSIQVRRAETVGPVCRTSYITMPLYLCTSSVHIFSNLSHVCFHLLVDLCPYKRVVQRQLRQLALPAILPSHCAYLVFILFVPMLTSVFIYSLVDLCPYERGVQRRLRQLALPAILPSHCAYLVFILFAMAANCSMHLLN